MYEHNEFKNKTISVTAQMWEDEVIPTYTLDVDSISILISKSDYETLLLNNGSLEFVWQYNETNEPKKVYASSASTAYYKYANTEEEAWEKHRELKKKWVDNQIKNLEEAMNRMVKLKQELENA